MTDIQQQQDWLDEVLREFGSAVERFVKYEANEKLVDEKRVKAKAAIITHFKQIIIDSDRTYTNEHDRQVANDYKASILAQLNGKE